VSGAGHGFSTSNLEIAQSGTQITSSSLRSGQNRSSIGRHGELKSPRIGSDPRQWSTIGVDYQGGENPDVQGLPKVELGGIEPPTSWGCDPIQVVWRGSAGKTPISRPFSWLLVLRSSLDMQGFGHSWREVPETEQAGWDAAIRLEHGCRFPAVLSLAGLKAAKLTSLRAQIADNSPAHLGHTHIQLEACQGPISTLRQQ
jgi:hypothetical protein